MRHHQWLTLTGVLMTTAASMLMANPAHAHVNLDAPNGGERLEVGSTFTIEWHIVISHNLLNWDIWYSTTGPNGPWIEVAVDLPPGDGSRNSVHTYDWVIPNDVSDQVRVRVRMDNSATDYYDISNGDLSIVPATLTSYAVTIGTNQGGTLSDIQTSDDVRAGVGQAVGPFINEAWRGEIQVSATTGVNSPSSTDVNVELNSNIPAMARIYVRNANTGNFMPIGVHAISNTDSVITEAGLAAADYVSGAGVIDIRVRVFTISAPTPFGYNWATDHVEMTVN